jgi:hypothetical protein
MRRVDFSFTSLCSLIRSMFSCTVCLHATNVHHRMYNSSYKPTQEGLWNLNTILYAKDYDITYTILNTSAEFLFQNTYTYIYCTEEQKRNIWLSSWTYRWSAVTLVLNLISSFSNSASRNLACKSKKKNFFNTYF